jgi:hypothetical protein
MKRIIVGLGLLLGAAVAGFFQAGGLSGPGQGGQPAPRVRTAERRAPREDNARQRPDLGVPPVEAARFNRNRPPDRRAPARWDGGRDGYRDGPSRPYPPRRSDRR